MFNSDDQDDDVLQVPKVRFILQVFPNGTCVFTFRLLIASVRILSRVEHDSTVDWDANNDKELNYVDPGTDATCTFRDKASTIEAHGIKFDSDLKDVREH